MKTPATILLLCAGCAMGQDVHWTTNTIRVESSGYFTGMLYKSVWKWRCDTNGTLHLDEVGDTLAVGSPPAYNPITNTPSVKAYNKLIWCDENGRMIPLEFVPEEWDLKWRETNGTLHTYHHASGKPKLINPRTNEPYFSH